MLNEYEIKKQICEIGKRIYDKGMVAANDGNISVKLNDNEFLCTIAEIAEIGKHFLGGFKIEGGLIIKSVVILTRHKNFTDDFIFLLKEVNVTSCHNGFAKTVAYFYDFSVEIFNYVKTFNVAEFVGGYLPCFFVVFIGF